jgi:predicted ATPase
MSFFHFHDTSVTSPLRQNARQEDTRYLRSDGSNLAAYLYSLANAEGAAHQKAWRRINDFVRRIAPFVKTLDPAPVDPSQGERSAIRLDWTDESDHVFGPHHLSDGTLRAIALITALAQPAESLPRFVSIDEPELGLHPVALAIFASLVRSVSMQCQVLLATQSPALLDHFEPEEVVVAERVAGETELRRLDSDDLAAWLEEYCLSDLYDKNVLGGRP